MNERKNKKSLIFIFLMILALGIIGTTIAYYSSSDTFTNTFNTSDYEVEAQEIFESPDKWLPGETIPKTVIATNKGETPIAVRIKLTPRWVDENNNPLPLKDNNNNDIAVINFNSNLNSKWIYQDGYYYYRKSLNQNESTPTLMESVTFNPLADITDVKNCETVNGVTSCITSFSGYSGGKYTLQVDIETSQYDQYKDIWSTSVEIKAQRKIDGMLKKQTSTAYDCSPFVSNLPNKSKFESITIVDSKIVPDNALSRYDVSVEQNGSVMAWYTDVDRNGKYELYIGQDGGVIANYDSSYAFAQFDNVKKIDLTYLDTSYVTDMNHMFYYNTESESVLELRIMGLETWDTGNVTDMSNMFSNLLYYDVQLPPDSTLVISGLDNWDTSNVTDMNHMFYDAGYTSSIWSIGDLSSWNVSKVEDMSGMFLGVGRRAETFTLGDLSNWDTRSVKNMTNMFNSAGHDATSWNIGDLSNWDTSNVTDMTRMFWASGSNATVFSLDLSNWNTTNVISMNQMFALSGGLTTTTWSVGNLSNWDTSKVTDMKSMFVQAGRNATTWNDIGTLKVYVDDISSMFSYSPNARATLNIYSNPSTYTDAFSNASTKSGSGITVNYSNATTNIDSIIATKSNNSNVTKGALLN